VSLVWLVLVGGGAMVAGWVYLCAKREWIPNWREKKRHEEALARGRRTE
jgi:DNA-directed RNA polymerase specialized sigma24 family protein